MSHYFSEMLSGLFSIFLGRFWDLMNYSLGWKSEVTFFAQLEPVSKMFEIRLRYTCYVCVYIYLYLSICYVYFFFKLPPSTFLFFCLYMHIYVRIRTFPSHLAWLLAAGLALFKADSWIFHGISLPGIIALWLSRSSDSLHMSHILVINWLV